VEYSFAKRVGSNLEVYRSRLGGWPMILASLKSLLKTGELLEETLHWPKVL
jgi:hypothetical protein